MNETIVISIRDRVRTSVRRKLLEMARAADRADRRITKLRTGLAGVGAAGAGAAAGVTRFGTNVQRTNRGVRVLSTRIRGLIGTMRNLLVVSAAIGAGGGILRGVDQGREIRNRISSITDSGVPGEADAVRQALFDLANETRAPVNSVVTAFQRFDKALSRTGASQQEVIDFTRTITQALKVAGSSVTEVESTLLQLGQALTKGNLDGEELRAIRENAPIEVMESLANALGVNVGQLKELGRQGRITTSVIRQAFRNLKDGVQTDFDQLVPTIGESFTVLFNKIVEGLDNFNQETGFFDDIAEGILAMANNLDKVVLGLQGGAAAIASWILFSKTGAAIVGVFTSMRTAVLSLTAATSAWTAATTLATGGLNLLIGGLALAGTAATTGFIGFLVAFRKEIKVTEDGLVTLDDVFTTISQKAGTIFRSLASAISQALGFDIDDFSAGFRVFFEFLKTGVIEVTKIIVTLPEIFKITFKNIEKDIREALASISQTIATFSSSLASVAALTPFGRRFAAPLARLASDTASFANDQIDRINELDDELTSLADNAAAKQGLVQLIGDNFFGNIEQEFRKTAEARVEEERKAARDIERNEALLQRRRISRILKVNKEANVERFQDTLNANLKAQTALTTIDRLRENLSKGVQARIAGNFETTAQESANSWRKGMLTVLKATEVVAKQITKLLQQLTQQFNDLFANLRNGLASLGSAAGGSNTGSALSALAGGLNPINLASSLSTLNFGRLQSGVSGALDRIPAVIGQLQNIGKIQQDIDSLGTTFGSLTNRIQDVNTEAGRVNAAFNVGDIFDTPAIDQAKDSLADFRGSWSDTFNLFKKNPI